MLLTDAQFLEHLVFSSLAHPVLFLNTTMNGGGHTVTDPTDLQAGTCFPVRTCDPRHFPQLVTFGAVSAIAEASGRREVEAFLG